MAYLNSLGLVPFNEGSSKRWEGDGFFIRTTPASAGIFIAKSVDDWYDQGDVFHNLAGPCLLSRNGELMFAVNGQVMQKSEWERHQDVIEYRLQKAIKEVLGE